LAHFALTAQLLPVLRKSTSPRVVNVSSYGAREGKINFDDFQAEKKYDAWAGYYQSKLANLLFTLELQRRSDEGNWGIRAVSAHPGWSRTDLFQDAGNGFFLRVGMCLAPLCSQDAARGAEPQIYAATSPDAKPTGYYGPIGFLFEMKGPVGPVHLVRRALDKESAKKLWDVSLQLTGVTWG